MIVETSANQFFIVADHADPELSHVYRAVKVKRVKGGWVTKPNAREILIRKAFTRIVT